MIHEVKITKGERNKKTNNRKKEYNHLTPPKYTDRKSTLNQVNRFEKKFGYDYDLNG